MVHLSIAIILTLAAFVTAILYLRGEVTQARPLFRPLTSLLILVVALMAPMPIAIFYKAAVVLALSLTLLRNALELLPTPPALALANNLLVALLYMTAFASQHPLKWPTPWALLPLLGAGLVYWLIRPRLAELHSSLIAYSIGLYLMSWQALEMLVTQPAPWAMIAAVGALAFVSADVLLGLDHFYRPVSVRKFLYPTLTLLAQLLLALSIWGPMLQTF